MILTCPRCSHIYSVCLDSLHTSPVFVRCKMCGLGIEFTTEKLVRTGPTETKGAR